MRKSVIITGASGNLGRAAVERFSADGHLVIATVSPGRKLNFDTPENVVVYPVDLRDEVSVNAFVGTVIKEYGVIDAALLLAGGFAGGDLEGTDGARLNAMISLNFETAYYAARAAFLQMIRQDGGGRIVLVGSRPALEPKLGRKSLAYSLSKSMLFTLARMLNAEAEGKNVVTSVIVPSTIDTPANRADMPKADFSLWVRPDEIVDVLSFLTSQAAHPVTDAVVKIYGNPRRGAE